MISVKTHAVKAGLSVGLVYDDSLDGNDGVAQYVKTLGAWLTSQGHEVSYLAGQTSINSWAGGPIYSLAHNVPVVFNHNRLSVPLPARKSSIRNIVEKKGFDIVHVMMPYSPFMAQKVIRSLPDTTAVIGTFHVYPAGRLSKYGGQLLRRLHGRSLKRFDSIISVSPAAQNYAKAVFGLDSQVLPNPIDLERFKTKEQTESADLRIVFLGRLVPRKGCIYLIRAFAHIKNRSARLIVAGDGPQRPRLLAEAKKLGAGQRVDFLGQIAENAKPSLLASADIACFPSLYGESFGIVLIEAMAAGSGIVLGGDNPGYRSVLGSKPELLIDPADTAGFARRLDELLEKNNLTKELHNWQLTAVKQYDINQVGAELVEIYRRQIAHRRKKSNN